MIAQVCTYNKRERERERERGRESGRESERERVLPTHTFFDPPLLSRPFKLIL